MTVSAGSFGTRDREDSKARTKDKFEHASAAVLVQFKEKRGKKVRVGPRWLRAALLREVKKHYPEEAKTFKCSEWYLRKWRKRNGISIRRRTNTKKKDPEELRKPLQRMHAGFKRRVVEEGKGKPWYSTTEGSWRVKNRFSIDQVPLNR